MTKEYNSIDEILADLASDCRVYDEIIEVAQHYQKAISDLEEDGNKVQALLEAGTQESMEEAELYLRHRSEACFQRLDEIAQKVHAQSEEDN